MAPMMENINRLLGELRSTDLFISAAASGNDFEDSEEGEHAIIIRKLLIPANIGESTMLHLRLLHATVYAERFITQASDRFQVFSASERMVKACITTLKAQKTQTDGAADALAQEKLQLLQGAHNLLAEGCKLLASGRDAKESMKERFAEYRRREEDILNSCRRQYSAAIDAEVAIALQSLIDREDVLLQGHLSRLTSLAAAAQLPSAESRSNKQKAARALHSYSNECRAHFKQALKITTEALHKQLSKLIKTYIREMAQTLLRFCVCVSTHIDFYVCVCVHTHRQKQSTHTHTHKHMHTQKHNGIRRCGQVRSLIVNKLLPTAKSSNAKP